MATLEQIEALLTDVNQRLKALPEHVTQGEKFDAHVQRVAQQLLEQALADENGEVYRKMRFGGAPAPLVGSKYARWGLSLADVEFLYDLQTSLKGQRKVTLDGAYQGPSEELTGCYKAITDAVYLPADEVRKIDQRALDDLFPRIPKGWFNGRDQLLAQRGRVQETDAYQRALKAMDSAESGFGAQLIGAQYVADLWEAARRESRVFALLEDFEMRDPTAYLPVEVDIPEMLFVSESTANNSANYATVKTGSQRVQVDAKKFVIHQMWSGELEEDSIIPFIPFLRRQAQLSLAHYADSLVLNGDTTNASTGNINLDDADPADTKHYLAFDGIRHVGLVDNTANQKDAAGALDYNMLRGSMGRMLDATRLVDWGHPSDPTDLVYVAEPDTADRIAELDELKTFDKAGQMATVFTGQVTRIGQHPVIASIAVSKTEADGKVSTTGGNNTKGQVVVLNRRGFKVGWRRRVRLETERLPATDQTRLVYSLRMGFGRFSPTGAASGIEAADTIFDISV